MRMPPERFSSQRPSEPTSCASKIAEPWAARLTVVEEPMFGRDNGVPSSAMNFTDTEVAEFDVFVKYTAVYHPPPNANWGRTNEVVGVSAAAIVALKCVPNTAARLPLGACASNAEAVRVTPTKRFNISSPM